jgi:REP element-mobilizing transposase RayT
MARRPRVFGSGLLYHVIARGNRQQDVFTGPLDYRAYLERLAKYREKYNLTFYAYCLMPNHVHLLLQTADPPLAKFMQAVQQSYTQYFNRLHAQVGHVFQGRYKAIVCERETYLYALIRYIHRNPVRAKLVDKPGDYLFSSHGIYLAGKPTKLLDPTVVLGLLNGPLGYERFVSEGHEEGHKPEYYKVEDQQFLGREGFGERVKSETVSQASNRSSRSLPVVLKTITSQLKIDPAVLRSRDRRWEVSRVRTLIAYVLVNELRFPLGQIAALFGRDGSTLSALLNKFRDRMDKDRLLKAQVARLSKKGAERKI